MKKDEMTENQGPNEHVQTAEKRTPVACNSDKARRDQIGRLRASVHTVLAASRQNRQKLSKERQSSWERFRTEVRSKLRAMVQQSRLHRTNRTQLQESGPSECLVKDAKAKVARSGKPA